MPPAPKPPAARSSRNRSLVIALAGAGLVAAALIAGSIAFTGGGGGGAQETGPAGGDPVTLIAGIPQQGTVLGNSEAAVRMLQFEDIQCPFCKRYEDDALPAIVEEYVKAGRVKIDFRGLAFLGPDSDKALRIVVAAGIQNKLWEVAGLFFQEQGEENSGWVTDARIDEILAQVPGLDAARVKVDAQSEAVVKEIAAAQAEATALQVQGTPAFAIAIGSDPPYAIQPGSLTPSAFRPALDDALGG